jgi:Domain of unknown function (DUF4760)
MRNHPATVLWLMLFVVAMVGMGAPLYGQFFYSSHPIPWLSALPDIRGKDWFAFGGIIAALITFLAWAIINLQIAVRKHTIDVLLSACNSAVAQQKNTDFTATYKTLPSHMRIALDDWNVEKNDPAINAATYLLNYFELIAIAIRERDLDERLMRESLAQIVATLTWMCAAWIDHQAAKSPEAWKNLRWLHERWKLHEYDDMLAGIEKVGVWGRLKRLFGGTEPAPVARVDPTLPAASAAPAETPAPAKPGGEAASPAAAITSAEAAATNATTASASPAAEPAPGAK